MNLLITYIILNIVNVILQTAKSIVTIKCGKALASIFNALAYGLYTVVVIYMVCDLPLAFKVAVVAICNLVGVYVVKFIEERSRRQKIWKIEVGINKECTEAFEQSLEDLGFTYNKIEVKRNARDMYNIYSRNQKESRLARELMEHYNARYFVTENKGL